MRKTKPLDGKETGRGNPAVSDNYDEFEDFEDNSPAGLRKALAKAKAEAKAALKRAEEAEAKAKTAEAQAKKASISDLLRDQGIDPKFARLADRDGAEATEEGVKAWVEENKDFYNFGAPKREVQQHDAEDESADDVDADYEAQIRAAQSLDAQGVNPSEVAVERKIQGVDLNKIGSRDELLQKLAELGAPLG